MILVTGGTGFIGRRIVLRLALVEGQRVRLLSRDPGRFWSEVAPSSRALREAMSASPVGLIPDPAGPGAGPKRPLPPDDALRTLREVVETVAGDVRDDPARLAEAMKGTQAVVHTVAILRETQRRTFQSVNVEGTENVVKAMQRAGLRRLVHLSALGTVNAPRYRYIYSKWLGEQAVLHGGLDHTVLKPSFIYGDSPSFLDNVVQTINMAPGVLPLPDGGRALFQPLWVEDLVTLIMLCLKDNRHVGQSYEIGGPEHWSLAEIYKLVLRVRGQRRVLVPVLRSLFLPGVVFTGLAMKNPPATPDELKQLEVDNYTDVDAVQRIFGFKPGRLEEHIDYVREIEAGWTGR
ncbi:MAG: NAD(P)H-binding protein [Chloroflexi bacterium]|nr:NAD(P)H-binding protein [Chloroflexota bacterium]